MEVGVSMSFALNSRRAQPCLPDRGRLLSKIWNRFFLRRRGISQIDVGDLPEDVLRDIGLRDGKAVHRHVCGSSAWREAMLSYPPRGL